MTFLSGHTQISWSPDGRYLAAARAPSGTGTPRAPGSTSFPHRAVSLGASRRRPRPPTTVHPPSHPTAVAWRTRPANRRRRVTSRCWTWTRRSRRSVRHAGWPTSIDVINGLAWTRDGTSVIYDSERAVGVFYLWRVGVDGTRPPERIEVAGLHARMPATVPSRDRLAFSQDEVRHRHLPVRARPRLTARDRVVIRRSPARSSPRTVVASRSVPLARARRSRSGWLRPTGPARTQLTHGPGRWQGSPHWSPDGRQIAFDSEAADGRWHIWTHRRRRGHSAADHDRIGRERADVVPRRALDLSLGERDRSLAYAGSRGRARARHQRRVHRLRGRIRRWQRPPLSGTERWRGAHCWPCRSPGDRCDRS